MADVRCGSCGEAVPEGPFCVRCGAPLGADPSGAQPSHRRSGFAAAPHERARVPRIVSTLFPQLPRTSLAGFRVALGAGLALVFALGVLRIVPIAMIAAALLVPLLTLLYLYDVDVYEDEPGRVIAVTMLWGAAAGVGVALLTRSVTDTGAAFLTQPDDTTVLVQGILLPLLGLALTLAGPLALLRYHRFNDALDGVTFGAACAAAFAGAEVITYGFSVLSGGLRPHDEVLPLLARLGTIAGAIPVLEMALAGSVAGALWLRYRAPVRDRGALGTLGNPLVALVLAALGIAVAFSLQPLIEVGWWLLCLVALDVAGIVWLRRLIHVGLLEEAAERRVGPPLTCANCGAETPRHTFCINCGISLQALPKHGAPSASAPRRGSASSRFGRGRIVPAFLALLLVLSGAAVLIAVLSKPSAPKPLCPNRMPCARPPVRPGIPSLGSIPPSPRLIYDREYVSSAFGHRFEYPSPPLTVTDETSTSVTLAPASGSGVISMTIQAAPASRTTPAQLLEDRLSDLRTKIPDLARDDDPSREILSPALGYRGGVGGFYRGNLDAPNGFVGPADVAVLAATDGQETLSVSITSADRDRTEQLFALADSMLNTLRFKRDASR